LSLTHVFSLSPNFYILDEPTNHLDMETIEALAKALNKFKVSLLIKLEVAEKMSLFSSQC
jgi:ATP-binding cassette subfamily F protein 3